MSQTPLDRFAALELVLHAVARSASPFRVSEIVNDGFNKRVSSRIHLSLRQVRAASEALPQKAPQPAWLGGRYGNTRRHRRSPARSDAQRQLHSYYKSERIRFGQP